MKQGRVRLFVLLLVFVLPGVAFAQELYLNGTVVVGGQSDTLGSISLVTGGGTDSELQRLLTTPLPPLADHPALVPARDLRTVLNDRVASGFVLVGGPVIFIPKGISTPGERAFYTSLLQSIESRLGDPSLRVEVWPSGDQSPDLSGVHGPLVFQFPAGSSSAQALIANNYLEYKGKNDPTFSYLPIHVRIEALVPVARNAIPFGSQLTQQDVLYRAEDISSLSGATADLSGSLYTSRTDIAKGSVIYRETVGKVDAISAGKRVRIAFRKGNVEVSVPGSAYESGSLGDTIAVAPLDTGKRYHGTVVSPLEVVVED